MKKIFLIVVFLCNSLFSFSFEFSPVGFDKRIDTGEGYGEFQYHNSTLEIQRYKISIMETGNKNDIGKYVSIYPNIITVKPQSSTTLKVYVQAPSTLKKGLYSFMLRSQSVPVPFLQKKQDGRISPAVSMKTSVVLEMEAFVGAMDDPFIITDEETVIKKENGKNVRYYKAKLENKTGRGYHLGVGFVDSADSLITIESKGRVPNGGIIKLDQKIPPLAKKIVFYDYNNRVFLKQKINIK